MFRVPVLPPLSLNAAWRRLIGNTVFSRQAIPPSHDAARHECAFGSCKRLGGDWSQRMKLIFWEMIQGEKRRGEEGVPLWAACKTRCALEVTVATSVWKLEEAERGGPRGARPGTESWRLVPRCALGHKPCSLGLSPTSANKN